LKPVYILTEGNQSTGFGHITRCLSIYQAFLEKNIQPTFIINGDDTAKPFLLDINCIYFDWLIDSGKLLAIIPYNSIVIIDSLLAELSQIERIIMHVSYPVIIDDFKRLTYSKGLIIDWTVFSEKIYKNKTKDTYLAGYEYIALRKEFWNLPSKKNKPFVENILITMGGNDLRNLTPDILNLVQNEYPNCIINVIVGKAFRNTERINFIANKNTKTILLFDLSTEQIVGAFLNADIVISAGGQTLYELARTGTPTIAIMVVDNQQYDIEGWAKAGFIDFAGNWNDKNLLSNISLLLSVLVNDMTLRENKSILGQKMVDGKGALKIIDKLLLDTLTI
jgi:spore coat polysaccharide biosynthesis predicted glycosyltransferase SpsG